MKILKNLFKKQFSPIIDDTNRYRIYHVQDSASIFEALGIDKERTELLFSKCNESFQKTKTFTEALQESSKFVNNANELALIIHMHLTMIYKLKSANDFIGNILKMMK